MARVLTISARWSHSQGHHDCVRDKLYCILAVRTKVSFNFCPLMQKTVWYYCIVSSSGQRPLSLSLSLSLSLHYELGDLRGGVYGACSLGRGLLITTIEQPVVTSKRHQTSRRGTSTLQIKPDVMQFTKPYKPRATRHADRVVRLARSHALHVIRGYN